jgi:hypothetical protein
VSDGDGGGIVFADAMNDLGPAKIIERPSYCGARGFGRVSPALSGGCERPSDFSPYSAFWEPSADPPDPKAALLFEN